VGGHKVALALLPKLIVIVLSLSAVSGK